MNDKLKKIIIILISIALLLGIAIFAANSIKSKNVDMKNLDIETMMANNYNIVTEESGVVEEAPDVNFRVFFLKDLDGDGYVEQIDGSCKELGGQDTLYMELNVEGQGSLIDPVITIDGKNFYLQTKIPRDDEVKENAVGNNVKRIVLNNIATGTNKILTGMVRSGDYSSSYSKNAALNNNINNYSNSANTVTLSGTYLTNDGQEIPFEKVHNLTLDWYGTASTYFKATTLKYEDLPNRIDETNGLINLSFSVTTIEGRGQLIPKINVVEGTMPLYRGYEPEVVSYNCASNETFTYDPVTRNFTITRESIVDEEGNVLSSIGTSNTYNITLKYPLEAYTDSGEEVVDIQIPLREYYDCYNNPTDGFENPYRAESAASTIRIHYQKSVPNVYAPDISIKTGTYYGSPYNTQVISKKKPIRLYNRISQEETNDDYNVTWNLKIGTSEISRLITIKENDSLEPENQTVDKFSRQDQDTGTSLLSMEEYVKNVGIKFSGLTSLLKEEGTLKVIDEETDEVLLEIDSFNKSRYENTIYNYEMPVAHIRIEIEGVNVRTNLSITNIKRLDDDKILENFTREEFNKLKKITSYVTLFFGDEKYKDTEGSAVYDEPNSVATIDVLKDVLSTQKTEEGDLITIYASYNQEVNQVGWVDGEFLVKLPKEIIKTKINSIEINNIGVEVTSYELVEDDTNTIGDYIRIKTHNIDRTPQRFNIVLNVDLTPDPRISTTVKNVELYATNANADDYYYLGVDTYDVNSNLNVVEYVNKTSTSVNFISPNSLLTTEMVLNFDDAGTVIVSPQVADVTPQYASVDNDESRATIGVQIKNNYAKSITDVIILGKIPFEGNTTVLRNRDLNSAYSSKMVSEIRVPESLQSIAIVYYSTNPNPNKDLTDTSNGWVRAEDVENWDNIKTYLIDFGTNEIIAGNEYVFYYDVEIPSDIDFNKISYGHHGVYFSLITDEGKYRTQIEPNPVGLRIAQKYNFDVTKYILNNNAVTVPGASYTVVEVLGEDLYSEEVKSAITDVNGKLEFKGLYGERIYEIRETISPTQYVLNTEHTQFVGHVANDGTLTIEILSGTGLQDVSVSKVDNVGYVVSAKTEDEVKAKLKVTKTEKDTDIKLSNTKFSFKVQGSEEEKYYTTDANGEILIDTVDLNTSFVLTETKAKTGYYLIDEPISFKVVRNGAEFEVQDFTGTVKANNLVVENGIPVLNIELEDEKIPTYDLEILKVSKGENTPLEGIKFNLYKENKRIGTYETDENGRITITGLYQFEDRKNIDQTYVLKEISTVEGYSKVKDIEFSTKLVEGVLVLTSESSAISENVGTATKVTITVENPKTFELTKKDGETGELLPNTKFAIYNIENGDGSRAVPAVDVKGRIVGTPIEIDGNEYYYVETDANGKITANLPAGIYKAVEIEAADDKYDISKRSFNTVYFGIGESKAGGIIDEEELNEVYSYNRSTVANERAKAILVEDGVVVMFGNSGGSYLAKFNNNNEIVWERRVYTGGYSLLYDICRAEDGGIITAGDFDAGTTIPGTDTASGEPITITNSKGALVFKYNQEGKLEWYRNVYGGADSYIHDVYISEEDGDIYVCGRSPGNSNFVEGITCTGSGSGFVVRYDKNGTPIFGTRVAAMTWGVLEKDGYVYSGGDSGLYKLTTSGSLVKTISVSGIKSVTSCEEGILVTSGSSIRIYDEELNQIKTKSLETTALFANEDSFGNINVMLSNGKVVVLDGSDLSETINKTVFSCANNIDIDEMGKILVSGALSGKVAYALTGNGGNVPEQSEITFNNYRKEFKITTDIDLFNGVKGGTISGEDLAPYEKVKYGDTSVEPIVITPNSGYKINYIKINDEEIFNYEIDDDGKVTLPQFDNVIENKHITVQFLQTSNAFKIKKVDEYSNEPIEGVTFKLDQLEERPEPNSEAITGDLIQTTTTYTIPTVTEVLDPTNPIGSLTPMNEKKYTSINEETAIEGVLGTPETTQDYYFTELDGALIPTNSKVYRATLGETSGIRNTIAESYIKIDLSGLEGYYALKVNADISARNNNDYGYAAITRDTRFITYNNALTDKFFNITGVKAAANYYTNALKGGNIYYLHIGYRKSNNADLNDDVFKINSINVYPCEATEYYFEEVDGKYVSGNTGIHNSYSASYIPIDLTEYTGSYMLDVNYDISSQTSYDSGYTKVSEESPSILYTTNPWFNTSGNSTNQERTKVLTGGKKYYLNVYYYKNGNTNSFNDNFTINSIKLYETESRTFNFEEVDGKYVSTNQGYDRTTSWSIIPLNLTDYPGKYNIEVDASISSQTGDIGYVSYSTTQTSTGTNMLSIQGTTNDTKSAVLTGGRIWYLHIRYVKNDNTNSGDDKFTFNGVNITLNDGDLHHTTMTTNSIGEATCQIPYGLYRIEETGVPEGYEGIEPFEYRMNEESNKEITVTNRPFGSVVVHHYLKDNEGNYTTTRLADDVTIKGKVGTNYSTEANLDIVDYDLEKNGEGNYVVPPNATGQYAREVQDVNYYYETRKTVVVVHHYIEGTSSKVPLANGSYAQDVILEGRPGDPYTTSSITNEELSPEYELASVPELANGNYPSSELELIYYYKPVVRKLTIQKFDEDGVTPLENVKFEISGVQDRVEVGGVINNGTYYMKKVGNKYVSNNKSIANSTADSYIRIDMTNAVYDATVTANVLVSSQGASSDFGYMYITESTNAITSAEWNGTVGRLYKNGGNRSAEDVTPYTLAPGKVYYLHMGYHKNGSTNSYNDEFTVNSINISVENKYQYTTNNEGKIELDLKTGNYELKEIETLANYILDSTPREITIDRTSENQTITITNTKRRGTVVTNYYIEGTTDPIILADGTLAQSTTKTGVVGEIYATSPCENVTERYDLVAIPENASGNYTEDEIVVNYYYRENYSNVVVHYYIEGTETSLVPDVNIPGYVTQEYTTESASDLPPHYSLVAEPTNKNGRIAREETEVFYYYYFDGVDAVVNVHYIDISNGNTIADDVVIRKYVGDPYKAESKVIPKYRLLENLLPSNAQGTMTVEPITVNYYYELDESIIEVHHKNTLDGEDLVPVSYERKIVGEDYSIAPIAIPGYDVDEEKMPSNASGTMTSDPIVVNYYYAKISSVTVHYVDKYSGEPVADPEVIPGHEGGEYHSRPVNVDDYILVEEPTNKDGIFPFDPIEITYYYVKESAGVTEKHIDEKTNEILFNKHHPGDVGEEYNIEQKEFNNYKVDENKLPENSHGYMTEEPIEVIYYYRYETPITVEYIDRETGNKLTEDVNKTGFEGDTYTTEEKTFTNYKLVEVPKNKEGTVTRKPITVKYYYAHDSAGVIVHYIDEQTNKEIEERMVIPGQEGDTYEAIAKTIDNYELNLNKTPTNEKGKMTKELIEVYYYYSPKAKVIIEYIDKETGDLIEKEVKDGHVGDNYHSSPRDFEYYQVIEEEIPENKDGTMGNEPITVRYYYYKKATVNIEYIDNATNMKIIADDVIYGKTGEEYSTKEKVINGYKIVTDKYPSNSKGVFGNSPITVSYYYEKVDKEPDIVINNNNNNDIRVNMTDSNVRETVVVIGDNSSNNQNVVYTNNPIIRNTVNPNSTTTKPTVTSNTDGLIITPNNKDEKTTSIVYDVPNTEKNSYYHIGSLLLIAAGWYIIIKNKQDEK